MSRLKLVPRKPTATLRSSWQTTIDDHVIALAWSPPAGRIVAAAAVSGAITLFDAKRGEPLRQLKGHNFGTTALAWQPDGEVLASSGQDGKVRLWQATTGEQMAEMAGGAAWVEHVVWCPSKAGQRPPWLASAAGKVLRLWDSSGALIQEHTDHPSTIHDMAWHAKRNQLALVPYGGVVLLDPDQGAAQRFTWQGASLKLAWSPDGHYVATGDQDATVHFWYAKTGKDLQMWGYPTKVRELAWDSTSRYLATGGSPTVVVWDCSGKGPEGTKPTMLEAHEANLSALAFQHKGLILASAGNDGKLYLWLVGGSKKPLAAMAYTAAIAQIAWSPDDRWLVAGTASGVVEVFAVNVS